MGADLNRAVVGGDAISIAPSLSIRAPLMIAWKRECYRSSATAALFGSDATFIWPGTGKGGTASRYVGSFWKTVDTIRRSRPENVIILNQPPFLVVAALAARIFSRFNIILDFHSGALSKPIWRPFLPLYRYIVRTSPFVIAHNRFDGAVMERWGGKPIHLMALPASFPSHLRNTMPDRSRILVVCSFADDEPVNDLLAAMKACPNIQFEVTGKYQKAGLDPSSMPENVRLLGFVDYDEYLRRFSSATAVATFSTRSHIMQMAVEEAVSLGVPVVTNESPTLREVLGEAGVFCEIDAAGMAEAFGEAVSRERELRTSASALVDRRDAALRVELDSLLRRAPDLFQRSEAD